MVSGIDKMGDFRLPVLFTWGFVMVYHGSLNVPMEHHPTIRYIWSIMATIRWCPIYPKWDIYQSLFMPNIAKVSNQSSCNYWYHFYFQIHSFTRRHPHPSYFIVTILTMIPRIMIYYYYPPVFTILLLHYLNIFTMSGWWFGTFGLFFPSYWECHHPNWLSLHHFSGG